MKKIIFSLVLLTILSLFFSGCVGLSQKKEISVKEDTILSPEKIEDIKLVIENIIQGPEKTVAVLYRTGDGQKTIRWVNKKNEIQDTKAYDEIRWGQFSPDGDLVFLAKGKDSKEYDLFINKEKKEKLGEVINFKLTNKGKNTYILKEKTGVYFINDGNKSNAYNFIDYNYVINGDGDVAFIGQKSSGTWVTVLNGKESKEYSAITQLVFNESGKLGYVARQLNNYWAIIKDNKATQLEENFIEILGGAYSKDNFAFIGQVRGRNDWHVIENGEDKYSGSQIRLVHYDVDGKLIYTFVSADGHEYISYENKNLSENKYWTIADIGNDKNGKTYFLLKKENGFWTVLFDGVEYGEYKRISDKMALINGDIVFVGQRANNEVNYIEMQPKVVK